ncbi:hypothetical protein Tco_1562451 [Tanacetum coccineum]
MEMTMEMEATIQEVAVEGRRTLLEKLALLCARMLPEESEQVEKYTGGLPDKIQGNVMSARTKAMQEAIELENDLMDQKVHTFAERQEDNERKFKNNPRDNHD